eukprot:12889242-Prorocentrum_lima.AAC.1
MDGPDPTCPARGDGEVELDLSDSSLPYGCLEGCLADESLDIVIPPALSEPYTNYSTFTC